MHVVCKKCGSRITVAARPKGSTTTSGVEFRSDVRVEGGGLRFGRVGSVSFKPGWVNRIW